MLSGVLLAEAERAEDPVEQVFGRGLSNNLANGCDRDAEVECDQIQADALFEGGASSVSGFQRASERVLMPGVDGDGGRLRSRIAFKEPCVEGCPQGIESLAGPAADPDRGLVWSLVPGWVRRQVTLVPDVKASTGTLPHVEGGWALNGWRRKIGQFEHEVRPTCGVVTAADALGLDGIGGISEAGGVDKHDRNAMDAGGFLDGVAGGSGNRGNDGTILTEEQVEEAGLTGIREAHESDAGTGTEQVSFMRGIEKALAMLACPFEAIE